MSRPCLAAPIALALITLVPACGGRAADGDVVGGTMATAPAPPFTGPRRQPPPSRFDRRADAPMPVDVTRPERGRAEPPPLAPPIPQPSEPPAPPPPDPAPIPVPTDPDEGTCTVDSVQSFCRFRPLSCALRTLHEDRQVEAALSAGATAIDAGSGSARAAEAVRAAECDCRGPSGRFTRVSIPSGTTVTTFYYGAGAQLSAVRIDVDTPTFCDGTAPEGWYGAPVDCACTGQ